MSALRIGILGARRRRQGLGPFVARYLAAAGLDVPCFLGTSDATNGETRAQLREVAGVDAVGYTDATAMVAEQRLDALAVLTPPEAHGAGLELALEHGLHALCEKPLLWGGPGCSLPDLVADGRRAIRAFGEAGLLLRENCQWPCTLPAYRELHPDGPSEPVERFEMRLTPASRGELMLADAVHHPVSLLQALVPAREVRVDDVTLSERDPEAGELELTFRYQADSRAVDVRIDLRHGRELPREAGFAVNGRWARRVVRTSDYALFFTAGTRVVDVPDPLEQLVTAFAGELEDAVASRTSSHNSPIRGENEDLHLLMMEQRLSVLSQLVNAFRGDRA